MLFDKNDKKSFTKAQPSKIREQEIPINSDKADQPECSDEDFDSEDADENILNLEHSRGFWFWGGETELNEVSIHAMCSEFKKFKY